MAHKKKEDKQKQWRRFEHERAQDHRLYDEQWLSQTANRLASDYQIDDVKAQRELLGAMTTIKHIQVSVISLDSNNWVIPRDLMDWKTARSKLNSLVKKLRSVEGCLGEIIDDPVLLGALSEMDPQDRLPGLVLMISEFCEIAQAAAAIQGKKGNRPHPTWMSDAVMLCRDFWRKNKGEEPARYFSTTDYSEKRDSTTEPVNLFSRWFCDVMKAIAGSTPSECDTLLRH